MALASACTYCHEPPPRLLLEGVEQFNRGEFFEQHETLETLWRAETRPVRRLYQGVLQIGVAFHQLRRGNYHGTVTMLARGAGHLELFPSVCQRVDVAALLTDVARARAVIEALGPARLREFDWTLAPRVVLV